MRTSIGTTMAKTVTTLKNSMNNDHDLLITLNANMKTLTEEVRSMSTQYLQSIDRLQIDKISQREFDQHKDLINKEIVENRRENGIRYDKIEARLSSVERNMYIAIGAFAVIQLLIKYFFRI